MIDIEESLKGVWKTENYSVDIETVDYDGEKILIILI